MNHFIKKPSYENPAAGAKIYSFQFRYRFNVYLFLKKGPSMSVCSAAVVVFGVWFPFEQASRSCVSPGFFASSADYSRKDFIAQSATVLRIAPLLPACITRPRLWIAPTDRLNLTAYAATTVRRAQCNSKQDAN